MNEHIAQVLMTWRQESVLYRTARLGLGFSEQTGPRSLLGADHHAAIRPADSQVCGHYQTHRLAYFPPHLSTLIKSLGVDAKIVQ